MSFEKELLQRLPKYEADGLIDNQSALRLKEHLKLQVSQSTSIFKTSLYFAGFLLIIIGSCLFIRNLWDCLSITIRLCLAFVPLLMSVALGIFVLYKQMGNLMRELVVLANYLAVFAMISIISSTLNINGNLYDFCLTMICLCLPITFIFRSSTGSVISLFLLLAINSEHCSDRYFDLFFNYAILASIGIFLFWKFYSAKPVLGIIACWIFCILAPIIMGNSIGNFILHSLFYQTNQFNPPNELGMIIAMGFLSSVLLYSATSRASKLPFWKNPFLLSGVVGILITTTQMNTIKLNSHFFNNMSSLCKFWETNNGDFAIAFTFVVIALVVWLHLFVKALRTYPQIWGSIVGATVFILYTTNFFVGGQYLIYVILSNLLMFVSAFLFVYKGIKNKSYLLLNVGILLLIWQAIIRMFVSDLDMLLRASLFVIFGVILVTTNWYINSKRQNQK
ncbi:MAG: DUF2157 domain-containing protein [Verrucomicrobiaceae bacterium]|nr:DUF2157 domain-containing protein [Verrucomicrobiaceae bacterium]